MHFTLHLTPQCNMRCTYCYASPHAGAAMSRATLVEALLLGARLSRDEGGSCGLVFFGGEPLLERELIAFALARACALEAHDRERRLRFHAKITTNGLLLDEDFLALAARHDLLIALSCDGCREAHDRHRQLAGDGPSFDAVLPRLRLLLAARPSASVLTVVSPDTAALLPESVRFLMDEGARFLVISLDHAATWSEAAFAALERAYDELAGDYERWTAAGRRFYLSPFEVKIAGHVDVDRRRRERCDLAAHQISVTPDGGLYPCVQFAGHGDWRIGDVRAGIDAARRAAVRARAQTDEPACADCALAERCNRTCGCLNFQATGDPARVSSVLCRHERIITPIADRLAARLWQRRDPVFLHKHYNAAAPILDLLADAAG